VDKASGLRADQTIILKVTKSKEAYPEALRRVSYVDPETNKRFVFLTNIFTIPAEIVAGIYKQQIELFFKWIKRHLRIKSFFGTSSMQ
jgi:IS4 transposase